MKIHVTESYSPILIQKVTAAELDFAVVPAFMGSRGLKVQHFLRTWETLVASPDKKMHLRRTCLRDVGPLKIVLPSYSNARRKPLETYSTTNGVDIARVVEMDAMMGTLDLISKSDWVAVIPALMMTARSNECNFRSSHWSIRRRLSIWSSSSRCVARSVPPRARFLKFFAQRR